MKKTLLIALFTFGATSAQTKDCKFEINKTDDFTKKKQVLTKSAPLAEGFDWKYTIQFGAVDDKPFINLSANLNPKSPMVIGVAEPSLMLMLGNDEIISLTAVAVVAGKTIMGGGEIVKPSYALTVDEIKKIKEFGIKKFRFKPTRFEDDRDIKKMDAKLTAAIDCLISTL